MRKIPPSGINLFQLIYQLIREYEGGTRHALNLSLGNPDMIVPAEVRALKKKFADGSDYDLSTYAEDKNLNQFAEGMVEAFSGVRLADHSHLRVLPTAGIKTASALLPLACGMHLKGRENFRVVTHLPAYDIMGTWSEPYLGGKRIVWPLLSKHQMKLHLGSLKTALDEAKCEKPDLIFVIRPGNPASVGASKEEWKELIEFCQSRGIRLANDGAYATLGNEGSHTSLSFVAKDYPDLEWVELFSMSKALSDPGQRLGVIVGSKDFIEDWNLIKGNTDSGPVPLGMYAYGELFKDRAATKKLLRETSDTYQKRLDFLIPTLKKAGFTPACETTAGFFTLWKTPNFAFGEDIVAEAKREGRPQAEIFNRKVITRTGLVGVHFTGHSMNAANSQADPEHFIRYAACLDLLDTKVQERLQSIVTEMKPGY